jgi:pRiA4b ORF-3-like protein
MSFYYEFEVSLCEVTPKIWRRFLMPVEGSTFFDLHMAIQEACGWMNYHLFLFDYPGSGIGKLPIAGIPSAEDLDLYKRKVPDARRIRLNSYFAQDRYVQCTYRYDFGDDWEHRVDRICEQELPEYFKRRLLGGERAFPPEDCGGLAGYERMVQAVNEGKDPEEEDVVGLWKWLGNWDPERFDLEAAKAKFDQ